MIYVNATNCDTYPMVRAWIENSTMKKVAVILALMLLAAAGVSGQPVLLPSNIAQFASSMTDLPHEPLTVRGRIYVPAHSSLLVRDESTRFDFSVTLAVQNTSDKRTLVIERIDFFNVDGQPIEKYLSRPIALKPYGAIQIVVAERDLRGGLGANFIVDWSSTETIDEPYVEAVMIGGPGTTGISFASVGRKVGR
ncbi:DUF3124 domain-containing protein [Bradyrhizobium sp. 1(2017)]|uniref:DUF3124 domain-containing protein n=1 Tax=Bradyrhizobium sp. 1(2017) TaxID=1404888 RepID=UPI00140EF2ED|nr:DUF3124 domain-containing protein [Bradyrhizobium sp. 1(2017)]QIO34895.1 DUF3124 domain-containing protein [Bradyrhizobium sp. 1(2017)]